MQRSAGAHAMQRSGMRRDLIERSDASWQATGTPRRRTAFVSARASDSESGAPASEPRRAAIASRTCTCGPQQCSATHASLRTKPNRVGVGVGVGGVGGHRRDLLPYAQRNLLDVARLNLLGLPRAEAECILGGHRSIRSLDRHAQSASRSLSADDRTASGACCSVIAIVL